MPDKPRKMILIGMDGIMYYHLKKFVDEGKMPNVSGLIQNGTLAEACPMPPCDTPTNWTTIATGARTGTHGITGFRIHLPGESLDAGQHPEYRGRSFESIYCNAEYLWDAADKAGMRCLVINYLVGWPPNFQRGMMIKGDGKPFIIAESMRYIPATRTNIWKQPFCPIRFKKIGIEASSRSCSPVLEAEIPIYSELIVGTSCLKVLMLDSNMRGYDTLAFDAQTIGQGETSEWIRMGFKVAKKQANMHPENGRKDEKVTGFFKFHLRRLSPDATDFELFRTPVFITLGWTYPVSLGEDLLQNVDALRHIGSESETKAERSRMGAELLGERSSHLGEAVEQADRLCQTIKYLKNSHGWDLCFFHYHLIDSVNHSFLGYLCPQNPTYTNDKYTKAMREYEAAYKAVDNFVGRLLKECIDDETLIVLVSDHAALPCWKIVRVYQAFIRADLLAYEWNREKGRFVVDFSNTKALPWIEPSYVWVNLKGRDPDGIVEPEDYESVREKSIQALRSLRDPETGKCPISLALRKEEAYLLGQFGDRVGDVVYFVEPGYQLWDTRIEDEWSYEIFPDVFEKCEVSWSIQVTGNHDQQLPLAKMGSLSNTGVLIINGPGVKRNVKLTKPIMLTDVAPTIAKVLGIPAPAQNEGKTIREALEP